MACLNASGVWCSTTYSFNVTSGNITQAGSTVAISLAGNIATANSGMVAGTYDRGSCCGTTTEFATWVGILGTAASLPAGASGTGSAFKFSTLTCAPALNASTVTTGGASALGATTWNTA